MAQAVQPAQGNVVQVSVTRRLPSAAAPQTQAAAQEVSRGQSLVNAPREGRGFLGVFRGNRAERPRRENGSGWKPVNGNDLPFYRNGVFD